MRQVADSYRNKVMIGEAYLPIDRLMAYYGADLTGFHLPFNFHLISTEWQPKAIACLIESYEAALPTGGWPAAETITGSSSNARTFSNGASSRIFASAISGSTVKFENVEQPM